ncbi:MAG: glycosyltransferase family 2 protein [Kiritimatiellae bacterium]|nr:glycosyltransferase family 2 protein [Kiritimatiellia bacterium]
MTKVAPFFSIVIANYNHGRFLPQALASVLAQDCQDFELIVVDGGSTDDSVAVIQRHVGRIAWWCSERDRGQSHAFNKGFQKARGRFLTWLNADDLLLPGALRNAKAKLVAHPRCQWLTGNFLRFLQDGTILECKWGPHFLPRFLQRPHAPVIVYGPTSFFAKSLYERVGPIDESLHLVMDTDLWLRFMSQGVWQMRLSHCCWGFRMHETSKTAFFPGMTVAKDISRELADENQRMYARYAYTRSRGLRLAHLLGRGLDGSALVYLWRQCFIRGRRIPLERYTDECG